MTFRPMKPETIARRAKDAAAEKLRRRTESVARLTELVARDPDGIWQELLDDAKVRLAKTLAEQAAPHATFGPSDAPRWTDCPGARE